MPFVQEQEMVAWKGKSRGSKRGSSEELELDLIEVFGPNGPSRLLVYSYSHISNPHILIWPDQGVEGGGGGGGGEQGGKRQAEQDGEQQELRQLRGGGSYIINLMYLCKWIVLYFYFHRLLKMARGSRKKSKKKSACSTLSNSSDQVEVQLLTFVPAFTWESQVAKPLHCPLFTENHSPLLILASWSGLPWSFKQWPGSIMEERKANIRCVIKHWTQSKCM